ncbi:hypothetical protein ACEPAG_2902 [Sanghuangporus baumii]
MRAYYYDDLPGDQRLLHDSGVSVPVDTLKAIGVSYWSIPVDEKTDEKIDQVARERDYKNRDIINVTKEGLGDAYEEKLKTFFAEHMHEDEEIRYIKSGSGFFDVRELATDKWIRIHVTPGDLLVVPSGIYHRFTLDEGNAITALRLFKDEPKWTPHNRGPETDVNPFRQAYVQSTMEITMSGASEDDNGGEAVPRNIVAIFHASFHPTKGNTLDWSLTHPSSSVDLTGVEFSVLPSGLHLVPQDVVYFSHGSHAGLAIFHRRPTKNKNHRGFRLGSLGVLLEECERPRPWMHLQDLKRLADVLYKDADRRERELEDGNGEDLLGGALGAPDVWTGWSDDLDGSYASKDTPTHHLPHLLRILGLSSLTLYKFVLSRRRILIYTLPPVEVAGVLAWIAADLSREHHMASRSNDTLGTPIPSLFSKSANEGQEHQEPTEDPQSPTVLGMVTLTDIPRLEQLSSTGKGWIACTTDAIFLEKPQYYDLVLDLTTSTPSRASRPALYMSKLVSSANASGSSGRKREKWKLESVRFTWSDVKLWTELDRILKLDSSQMSSHTHIHPAAGGLCCSPKSSAPGSSSQGANANMLTDAFRLYEDVCLLCATLWMGLGTWRSNSRQSFASRDVDIDTRSPRAEAGVKATKTWGAARAPGDEDWSMEGTHMRTLGMGIEGGTSPSSSSPKKKGKESAGSGEAKIRAVGLGIEGKPRRAKTSSLSYSQGHGRKASGSSTLSTPSMKIPQNATAHIEAVHEEQEHEQNECEGEGGEGYRLTEEEQEDMRRQNIQTTLALLQTFHANTVFWLSKLREMLPPPSSPSTPSTGAGVGYAVARRGSAKGIRLPSDDDENAQDGEAGEDEDDEEPLTITARDLLSLELGVLSELDARFVEWLVEAEGYTSISVSSNAAVAAVTRGATSGVSASPIDTRQAKRRRVVVKRGWQELFGILLGLK